MVTIFVLSVVEQLTPDTLFRLEVPAATHTLKVKILCIHARCVCAVIPPVNPDQHVNTSCKGYCCAWQRTQLLQG